MTSFAVRFALIAGLGMFSVTAQAAATATAPDSQDIRSSTAALIELAQAVIPAPGRPEGEPRFKKKSSEVIPAPGRPEGEPRYKKKKSSAVIAAPGRPEGEPRYKKK